MLAQRVQCFGAPSLPPSTASASSPLSWSLGEFLLVVPYLKGDETHLFCSPFGIPLDVVTLSSYPDPLPMVTLSV